MRCDNKNKLQDSAPCQRCLNTIIELNIKRIVFSSKDNTFISANPNILEIQHISAGGKFLIKNEEIRNKENLPENLPKNLPKNLQKNSLKNSPKKLKKTQKNSIHTNMQ